MFLRENFDRILIGLGEIAYLIIGLGCIVFSEQIKDFLPVICGIVLIAKGIVQIVERVKSKFYIKSENRGIDSPIVLITIGIGLFIYRDHAIILICAVWGAHGLSNSVNTLSEAYNNKLKKHPYILEVIEGLIEFALSFMLIFEPFKKVSIHIIILGIIIISNALKNFIFLVTWKSRMKKMRES